MLGQQSYALHAFSGRLESPCPEIYLLDLTLQHIWNCCGLDLPQAPPHLQSGTECVRLAAILDSFDGMSIPYEPCMLMMIKACCCCLLVLLLLFIRALVLRQASLAP